MPYELVNSSRAPRPQLSKKARGRIQQKWKPRRKR